MIPRFLRRSIVIIGMWPVMVVPAVGKFFHGTFKFFVCMVIMQFYKFVFHGVEITFHLSLPQQLAAGLLFLEFVSVLCKKYSIG